MQTATAVIPCSLHSTDMKQSSRVSNSHQAPAWSRYIGLHGDLESTQLGVGLHSYAINVGEGETNIYHKVAKRFHS